MEKNYGAPAKVTIKNAGKEDIGFRYFRVNFVEVLKPADSVILTVSDSTEVAYYKALEDAAKGLTVTVAKITAE